MYAAVSCRCFRHLATCKRSSGGRSIRWVGLAGSLQGVLPVLVTKRSPFVAESEAQFPALRFRLEKSTWKSLAKIKQDQAFDIRNMFLLEFIISTHRF